jgi:Flp pilus assembly pilin Flp
MRLAFISICLKLRNLVIREDGQDLVEVALLLLLITTGSFTVLGVLSNEVQSMLNSVVTCW